LARSQIGESSSTKLWPDAITISWFVDRLARPGSPLLFLRRSSSSLKHPSRWFGSRFHPRPPAAKNRPSRNTSTWSYRLSPPSLESGQAKRPSARYPAGHATGGSLRGSPHGQEIVFGKQRGPTNLNHPSRPRQAIWPHRVSNAPESASSRKNWTVGLQCRRVGQRGRREIFKNGR